MNQAVYEDTTPSDGFFPNIVSVGGGKGGIGKSFLSSCLGYEFARRGSRVLVVDLDLGGANLHAWLGAPPVPQLDLGAFLRRGGTELDKLISPSGIDGLYLIHGSTTNLGAQNLKHAVKTKLISRLRRLPFDWIILDLGAGTGYNTIDFFLLGNRGLLALTPEKTSIENGYRFLRATVLRLLKGISSHAAYQAVLKDVEEDISRAGNVLELIRILTQADDSVADLIDRKLRQLRLGIVLNQIWDLEEIRVADSIQLACQRHLQLAPKFFGPIRYDESVVRALRRAKHPVKEVLAHDGIRDDVMAVVENIIRDTDYTAVGLGEFDVVGFTNHYDILGVKSNASPSEIGARYRALKTLYSGGLGTYGLINEVERETSLSEVERAYFVLCDTARRKAYDRELAFAGHPGPWYEPRTVAPPATTSDAPEHDGSVELDQIGEETLLDIEETPGGTPPSRATGQQATLSLEPSEDGCDGKYLRSVRELRNMSLEEVSQAIKITVTQLEHIEAQRFEKLPAPVYLRGFLKSYAQYVGIDAERVIEDMLALRAEWAAAQP